MKWKKNICRKNKNHWHLPVTKSFLSASHKIFGICESQNYRYLLVKNLLVPASHKLIVNNNNFGQWLEEIGICQSQTNRYQQDIKILESASHKTFAICPVSKTLASASQL